MNRLSICLISFFLCCTAHHAAAVSDERPNLVFILSDDQRWDQLGCSGHPIIKTPHIDQLADDGVRFDNMFVTTSICAASRASIFTGMFERGHRYTFGTKPLSQELVHNSYPHLLKKAGYRTGFVGKFGIQIEGKPDELFDYFNPLTRNPYFKEQPDGSRRHVTQLIGDGAIQFLKSQHENKHPFCLSVSFNAPHAEDGDKDRHYPVPDIAKGMYDEVVAPSARLSDPAIFDSHPEFFRNSMLRERFHWRWDTPQKFQKNMRGYWGMISGVDHVVGRIRNQINELGIADNTILIFTSDNGYFLGQRGFAGKWSHHEESLRVPLVLFDPRDNQPTARVLNEAVLNVDLAPTMLALAGISPPENYQGQSLLKLLAGKPKSDWRTDFFCEHLFHLPGRIPKYEGVRGSEWTYARYFEQTPPFEFLHDLRTDPDQLNNLASEPSFAEQLMVMRERCDELRDQLGGEYSREKFPLRNDKTNPPEMTQAPKPITTAPANRNSFPNVVLIISDDQKWTDYSFMEHSTIETPSLDRLAAESAVFVRGYVPTALCRPSLATIITGLYPRQHQITGNDPSRSAEMTAIEYKRQRELLVANIDRCDTLPRLLSKAGYLSFQSGKWWEGHYSRGGFTHGMTHGNPNRGGRHGDEGLKIGRQGIAPIENFIDHAQSLQKPFLIWYAPFLPHTPHNPPQHLFDKYSAGGRLEPLAKYYAMCEWFDTTCGQLLKTLDEKGLRDNTIVVYVTDNGWIQRTAKTQVAKGWKAQFAPRSKQSPNEGGVRTPIMIRWPGRIGIGKKQSLASSIDIFPTILSACGIDVPVALPGIDLLPLTQDGSGNEDRALYGEGYAHDIAELNQPIKSLLYRWVIQGRHKLITSFNGELGRHKQVHANAPKVDQLFDLYGDPTEATNLAADNPETVKRLKQLLIQEWDTGH